jgi:hypothetical protein
MAKILEFPQQLLRAKPEKDEPNVRGPQTLAVVERLIRVSGKETISEGQPAWTDLEALKDIYKMFSVEYEGMIANLARARENGFIGGTDEVLLFAIFSALKDSNSIDIISKVIEGNIAEELPEDVPNEIRSYLLRINQEIKNKNSNKKE